MLLNNYWNMRQYVDTHYVQQSSGTVDIGLKNMSGTSVNFTLNSAYHTVIGNNACMRSQLTGYVGTSDTAVQKTDYALGTDITSKLSNMNTVVNSGLIGDSFRSIVIISGLNNTGSTISLKEYGIAKGVYYHPSDSGAIEQVMLIRAILNQPIVLPNGQGFQIIYEWVEG